ncbi:MAG TPA: DUF5678 domain-containing protein [Candidatus Nanoarchaeia archaeon]|nr:DUF5678 domain-containing protein [Candidatus Nanoarchaeia archaeon]
MDKNYDYFMKTNVDKYIGEWIVVAKEKIVSHGKDINKVLEEAKRKYPTETPLLIRVPDKEAMIF